MLGVVEMTAAMITCSCGYKFPVPAEAGKVICPTCRKHISTAYISDNTLVFIPPDDPTPIVGEVTKKTLVMGKLVRDKVPRQIRSGTGRDPKTRILKKDEYYKELFNKIDEEAGELKSADSGGEIRVEIVDLLEVLHAIADYHSIPWVDIVEGRRLKLDAKGGFKKRIYMQIP